MLSRGPRPRPGRRCPASRARTRRAWARPGTPSPHSNSREAHDDVAVGTAAARGDEGAGGGERAVLAERPEVDAVGLARKTGLAVGDLEAVGQHAGGQAE